MKRMAMILDTLMMKLMKEIPLKIKVFSHTDLDGIACPLIIENEFKGSEVDVEYCTYESYADINKRLEKFIGEKEYEQYDVIFITDISVNMAIADLINDTMANKTVLLDHHDTVLELNKYPWAVVQTHHNPEAKASGASLTVQWLKFHDLYNEKADDFAELVRRYDTWEWKEKFDDIMPKQLSDLFRIYGKTKFYERFKQVLSMKRTYLFTPTDKTILELEQEKIDRYIYKKRKQMVVKEIYGYKVGVVYAEEYISELGNKLAEDNPELDFVAMISMPYTVSYRGVKDNIHLGNFAKDNLSGGGHPKSAGSHLPVSLVDELINNYFNTK